MKRLHVDELERVTGEARELLSRAYADPDFAEWAREEAARKPLLDSVRG